MEEGEEQASREIEQKPIYDVVIVHGGNIRRKGERFASTNFEPGEEKSFGGHTRSRSAAELYRNGKARLFIVSTGKTHPDPDAPTEASVMKDEIMKYGVPSECIIEEDLSTTTMSNLEESAKIIRERDLRSIGILSSSWHLARIREMLNTVGLEKEGRTIKLLSAEKILNDRSPHFKHLIKKVYGSDEMKKKIQEEKQGINALRSGKYQPRPIDYNPKK